MNFASRYTIVYNGELYNYIELRNNLKQKGIQFSTDSDTEVIIASYATYGKDCIKSFDGAFAFAIWDDQEQLLLAARDRFGEKPFFYSFSEDDLVFSSELKSLWKMGVKKEVNEKLLYNFLTIGYTSNPYLPGETFFEEIYKLPAACSLIYSLPKQQLSIEKYWIPFIELDNQITEQKAIEKFDYLFTASIQKRLRSDVAVGTSLSGGLDSSTIVAYCDKQESSQYTHRCFTAAFKGFEKDESYYATIVSKKFDLNHTIVETEPQDIVALMQQVMQYQEEPIDSASALIQFKVYEAAKRNGVTVLLDGQGADEVLGGYHKYYKWYWQQLFRQNRSLYAKEKKAAKSIGINQNFGVKEKLASLLPHLAFALQQGKKKMNAANLHGLNDDFAKHNKNHFYYSLPAESNLNSALFYNTFSYGLEELLRLADRNSMANSVEVRLPFLSHELVEFLFTLPPHLKINNGWTKWLLRKTAEPLLPKEIVWRKDKIGFEPPQKLWMENKNVQEAILSGKKLLVDKGILNTSVLTKKIQPHDAHAADNRDWKYWSASFLYA